MIRIVDYVCVGLLVVAIAVGTAARAAEPEDDALAEQCDAGQWRACKKLGVRQYGAADWNGATESFRLSLEHLPSDVEPEERAAVLHNLATVLQRGGQIERSLELLHEELELLQGAGSPRTADALVSLGNAYQEVRRFDDARDAYRRALDLGARGTDLEAAVEFKLGTLHRRLGDYGASSRAYDRALELFVAGKGEDHPTVAAVLTDTASLRRDMGAYDHARKLYEQALGIYERHHGRESNLVAIVLFNLGHLLTLAGAYDEAEETLVEVVSIRVALLGDEHPETSKARSLLASVYAFQGDHARAVPLMTRACKQLDQQLPDGHQAVPNCLNELAGMYTDMGDHDQAIQVQKEVLAADLEMLGPDHVDVARDKSNLARSYWKAGELGRAVALTREALAISERDDAGDRASGLIYMGNLAVYLGELGEFDAALEAYREVVAGKKAHLGERHPGVATALANMAEVLGDIGDHAGAVELLERAIDIESEVLPQNHPTTALHRGNLAVQYAALGRFGDSRSALQVALAAEDAWLQRTLLVGSAKQRRQMVSAGNATALAAISLHLDHAVHDDVTAGLAVTTVLRRKAIAVEAAALSFRTSRDEGRTQLIRALRDAYSELEAIAGDPSSTASSLDGTRARVAKLEAELSSSDAAFLGVSERALVTVERVAEALQPDDVLIEFVTYRPVDPVGPGSERFGDERYAAYVVGPSGLRGWTDLGPASEVDREVLGLRDAMAAGLERGVNERDVRAVATRLYEALLRPLSEEVGSASRVLISPDGLLALLPFDVLWDADAEQYLIERVDLTMLASGRELVAVPDTGAQRATTPAVVIAAADFGPGAPEHEALRAELCPKSAFGAPPNSVSPLYEPLPGTLREAERIAVLLPGAVVYSCMEASEETLDEVSRPWALHIASHGDHRALDDSGGESIPVGGLTRRGASVADPMLNSWVVLAGANSRARQGDPGLLTALEVSALDLDGTELAVLSACSTSVGPVHTWEGILGMQRALAIAGSKSQVLMLWSVSDSATAVFMDRFYRRVRRGQPKSQALSETKREFLTAGPWTHPVYWGAVSLYGDAGPAVQPADWTAPDLPAWDQGANPREGWPHAVLIGVFSSLVALFGLVSILRRDR